MKAAGREADLPFVLEFLSSRRLLLETAVLISEMFSWEERAGDEEVAL